MRTLRAASSWQEDLPDLPDPGAPVRTETLATYHRGVWSLAKKPDKNTQLFYALWRYPTVRLWQKLKKYNETSEQEEKGWKYLLLDCSFVGPITLNGTELSPESYKKIMAFSPGMIPASLLQKYLITTTLSTKEALRIERECYTLWASQGGSLSNPHPVLSDVIWSMTLHEKFGIQFWEKLDDLHVKIYAVMRKALECQSQAQDINMKSLEARRRAQQLTGVSPGGFIGR